MEKKYYVTFRHNFIDPITVTAPDRIVARMRVKAYVKSKISVDTLEEIKEEDNKNLK